MSWNLRGFGLFIVLSWSCFTLCRPVMTTEIPPIIRIRAVPNVLGLERRIVVNFNAFFFLSVPTLRDSKVFSLLVKVPNVFCDFLILSFPANEDRVVLLGSINEIAQYFI